MGTGKRFATILGAAALLLALPTAAHADPAGTPAGTGGGCQANGQEIAGNAQNEELHPFGATIVSQNVPIAPLVGAFFTRLCGSVPG